MKIAKSTFLGQISGGEMGGQSNFLGSEGWGDPTSLLPLGEALLCGVGKGIAQKNSREGQDQGMIYLWDG